MLELFISDEKKAKDLKIKKQEEQKTRNELFRRYSDKINILQETNEASHVVLQRLLEEYLRGKESFFSFSRSHHDDFCNNLIAILGHINSQERDKWISELGKYLNKNSINENLDLSELLNAFFKYYPEIIQSITNLNRKCVSNYSIIYLAESNILGVNETYRCISPIVHFFVPVKEAFKRHFKIESTTHSNYIKTISRMSRTCKPMYFSLKDEEMSLNELGHWTVRGHLIKVDERLKKNPELANKPITATALSDKPFEGLTGYQIAIFEHDKDMQAVYEKYVTKEQVEAQKNFLKENFALHNQLGLYFDITPLRLKMEEYRDNYSTWSDAQCEQYWQEEIGGEYRKFPAWLVYAMCEEGYSIAWTNNDLKNMKIERQYDKGHLELWFSKEYNGGRLGESWSPIRARASVLWQGGIQVRDEEMYTWLTEDDLKVIQSVEAICLEALNDLKANYSENNSSMSMKLG